MSKLRLVSIVCAWVVLAAALAAWAGVEAQRQRRQTETTLRAQAALLARALAPSLSASTAAVRELEELVVLKLLDNARLLARLDDAGRLDDGELARLVESNDLEAVLVLDSDGQPLRNFGADHPPGLLLPEVLEVVAGRASEAVIDWTPDEAEGHLAAAAGRARGGAVVVRTHASTTYAFASRLGLSNLLESTVGTGGVLYLAFNEEPGGYSAEAAWDGEPAPPPDPATSQMRTVRGRSTFEVDVPVPSPAGRTGTLRVGLDGTPLLAATVSATRRTALIGIVLAACGLAGAGFAVVTRARSRERAEGARRLAVVEEQRLRSERLAAAGALAAGVAHEIRNPLNAISMAAQRIERKHVEDSECREFALRIRSEVTRLEQILEGFLDLARPAVGPRAPARLRDLAGEVVGLLQAEAEGKAVRLGVEGVLSADAEASIDREAVRRALVNLVRNAIEASPRNGRITVAVEIDGAYVRFRVGDDGPGIEPGLAERVFDPFVTTRAEGVGLGLALVRRVAQQHGGWARLGDRPGGGTDAILELRIDEPNEGAR